MRIFTGTQMVPEGSRGASAALGNFDGVHLGHQSVLDIARTRPAPLGVVTFEPHPRTFFAPEAPAFRLMNRASRAHRLEKLGVDHLYELTFDAALAGLTAEAFARDVLAGQLGLSHVVVGADFRFGARRMGDVAMLRDLGARFGFEVSVADLLTNGAAPVSSTAIRNALGAGDPGAARDMLGHWHRIDGVIEHGEKRGRTLGFPTANMSMAGLHLPRLGVYAVLIDILDGPHKGAYQGAASLGVRPMFGENAPNLETFVFDFSGDLYGAEASVALVRFLRGEERFDSLDALIRQMDEDCEAARGALASL